MESLNNSLPTETRLCAMNAEVESGAENEASTDARDIGTGSINQESQEQNLPWATFKKHIGIFSLIVSFFSPLVLLIALAFLGWLWWGDRSNEYWRRIILQDHLKQAIPLTSLLITLAASSLASLVTSMIASIAVERRGVPLKHLATVSIVRFSTSGHLPALWNLLLTEKYFKKPALPILIIVVWFMVLATQFSSTLLLSDLGQGPVSGISTTGTNSSGLTYSSFYIDEEVNPTSPLFFKPEYWAGSLTTFETFAEYSHTGSSVEGLDDIGLTLRSFLPILEQPEREKLQSFRDSASVFDLRVACARPICQV
jgi:hypothetical protein